MVSFCAFVLKSTNETNFQPFLGVLYKVLSLFVCFCFGFEFFFFFFCLFSIFLLFFFFFFFFLAVEQKPMQDLDLYIFDCRYFNLCRIQQQNDAKKKNKKKKCASCGNSLSAAGGGGGGGKVSAPVKSTAPAKKWGANTSSSPSYVKSTPSYSSNANKLCAAQGGPGRAAPSVKSVASGTAYGQQSTTAYDMQSRNPNVVKPGLPPPTYEKQPDWAFAERHKNANLQYKTGQFTHLNR